MEPFRFGKIPPHLGTDGLRWAPRSSKPLRGVQNVLDVFDSHTFPPYATSAFVLAVCCVPQRRCFVFVRAFRSAVISAAVFSFVRWILNVLMEVFCRMTTVRRADLSCVVQAGGLSSRMGCDKARMAFCGEPLIERVLGRWRQLPASWSLRLRVPASLPTLRSARLAAWCRVWWRTLKLCGRMRGIASSLAAARLPLVAIVACDMPFVSSELIGALAGCVEAEALDVCVPREERGIEPLCAVWRRDACAPVAHELLACDRQRIRCLINRVQAGYMDEPQIVKAAGSTLCFENVNTPEEFAAAELLA